MRLSVDAARLIGERSDELDEYALANAVRDLVNSEVNAWPKKLTTTDATATTVWFDQMPANSVGDFMLTAVGSTAGAATVGGYRRRVVVSRPGTGALTIVGGVVDAIGADKEGDPTWDVTFAANSPVNGYLAATVQGAAATTVTWRVHVEGVVYPWE